MEKRIDFGMNIKELDRTLFISSNTILKSNKSINIL